MLLGFDTYAQVKDSHRKWVESALNKRKAIRDDKWTRSVAVGSAGFVEKVKGLLGFKAIGRKRVESGESIQLREHQFCFGNDFGAEKVEIGAQNTYFWN